MELSYIKKLILIALVMTAFSCQKKSEVFYLEEKPHILLVDSGLNNVMDADWMIGIKSKLKVSKGIKVRLLLPKLEADELEKLIYNFRVESWLVRIKKITPITEQTIGTFYIPFIVPGDSKSVKLKIKQIKQTFFNIFYHAAAFAPRYQYFQCPAFGHNRLVVSTSKHESDAEPSTLKLSNNYSERLLDEHPQNTVKPLVFNAGEQLEAEYHVELAFYNHTKNIKLSNFKRLDYYVSVNEEKEVEQVECEGYKIPESRYEEEKIKQFNFGR